MSDDVPVFALRPGQAASVRDFANRWLTQQEITEALAVPWTAEEEAEAQALIDWFRTRYPTGAARLAKARRSYLQWARSIPKEALEAEDRARRDETMAPGVVLELW